MATISPYIGDGSTRQFDLTFSYRTSESVGVRVGGIDVPFTFLTASRVQLNEAPEVGALVEVYRATPVSEPDSVFQDGQILRGDSLNGAVGQVLNRAEELGSELEALRTASVRVIPGEAAVVLPAASERAGRLLGFDAVGNVIPATSEGVDGGLRTDLANPTLGPSLVRYAPGSLQPKGTLGRKLQQIKSVEDYDTANEADADVAAPTLLVPADVASTVPYGAALKSNYWGFGQIKTGDGNKRGKWFSHINRRPTAIGNQDSIETAFNGDWSKSHFAIEHRVTGTGTLGTPTTGYYFTNEASAVFTTMESTSGHNQQLDGNDGRTSSVAFRTIVRNYGQGDCMAYNASGFVAGADLPGGTHWLAQPAVGLFAGDIAAGANHRYLNPREIICHDNGFDVACVGDVINMNRSNGTASQGEYWSGYRAQSVGPVKVDNIMSAVGLFRAGIDLSMSFLDFGPTKCAISLKANDRIYGGNYSANGQYTTVFNGNYLEYSSYIGGWNFVVAGGSCLQINAAQMTCNGVRFAANAGVTLTNLGNYADDATAKAAGVPQWGVYRNGSQLMIRVLP